MTDEHPPKAGDIQTLRTDLRCILAPNPSPMTYWGTNTYILGRENLTIIDPGPASTSHLEAILVTSVALGRVDRILVTHSHLDHSPLAKPLSDATGAPILAFGNSHAGRSLAMQAAIDAGLSSGGEGLDLSFEPDLTLQDGDRLNVDGTELSCWHTPGHMCNHMCFGWKNAVFCGDLVMGWASSLVSPPDGDLTDFMASCRYMQTVQAEVFYAGHGAPITEPQKRLAWLIAHRESREAQILNQLKQGDATANELAQAIYTETPLSLLPAATRNVFAHLVDLEGKSLVSPSGRPTTDTRFSLC